VAEATPNRPLGVAEATPMAWAGVAGHPLGGKWGGRTTPYFLKNLNFFYIFLLNINNILLFYIK
jgi:hypothetical protein